MKPTFVWESLSSRCLKCIAQFGTYRFPTNCAVYVSFVLVKMAHQSDNKFWDLGRKSASVVVSTSGNISPFPVTNVNKLFIVQWCWLFHNLICMGFTDPFNWFLNLRRNRVPDAGRRWRHLNITMFVGFCDKSSNNNSELVCARPGSWREKFSTYRFSLRHKLPKKLDLE